MSDRYTSRTVLGVRNTKYLEVANPDGSELTTVWTEDDVVYWEDPDECTVRTGTALAFHEWMVSKLQLS